MKMVKQQQQQQQQTDSPPETHSSDISEEDCADNGIPDSMNLDVAMLQIGGGASGTTAVDVDGEEQLQSFLPDPPSRSSNPVATTSNQPSALSSSLTTSIDIEEPLLAPAPAPSQPQHPSSSPSDVVIPDGGNPIRVTSDFAVEDTNFNSYVELAPTGDGDDTKSDDTREHPETADEEKNISSQQKQKQNQPSSCFMANHEHSNSLVHLPLLDNDNHEEASDDGDGDIPGDGIGSYNLAAAKMEALASVSSALDELQLHADEAGEEESPPSFDAEDSETERADPPGSSHERSTSIVIRSYNAPAGEGEDHPSQSHAQSDLLKGAEELADASTPPPTNNDEEEVHTLASNSSTPSDPTMDPEEGTTSTASASASPQQHDFMHQRQPTGTHISEGLLTIDQHQYDEVSIPESTATRSTPSPPPLSLDGDVAPPLPFAEKDVQFDNERESASQSQRLSPQSAPSPLPSDIIHQLQSQPQQQPQPHPLSLPKQNPNLSQPMQPHLQSPSRITYTSHLTGALSPPPPTTHPGRRSITLRLLEEISPPPSTTTNIASPLLKSVKSLGSLNNTPFRSLRRFRSLSLSGTSVSSANGVDNSHNTNGMTTLDEKAPSPQGGNKLSGYESGSTIDRGLIVVSWYEGTTSSEMQDHVFNCVLRKLNGDKKKMSGGSAKSIKLEDVRLLDENVTPHGGTFVCMLCIYYVSNIS